MNTNKISWSTKSMNIATFCSALESYSKERIDCDPVGQRPDTESQSKKQGIIDTVLMGYDFGELKLRTLTENVRASTSYKYRSIDGGHRKRAIRDFVANKFKTSKSTVAIVNSQEYHVGGKYFRELPLGVRDQFFAYEIRFTIYGESMTDSQASEIFRRVNISTNVNNQETLNALEDNLVARFIRETSRPVVGLNNSYHDLYEYKLNKKSEREQEYFKDVSSRLRDDEYTTRILTIVSKDSKDANWLTCSEAENEHTFLNLGDPITGVWAKEKEKAKQHQNLVIKALDFMLQYAKTKRNSVNLYLKMTNIEFVIVMRLYFHLVKTYGREGFKINNWQNFYESVRNAMLRFTSTDEKLLRKDTITDSKGLRTVTEAFKGYLGVHNDQLRCEKSVEWLLEEMKIEDSGIIFLDKKRVFNSEEIDAGWLKQDKLDWIDGKPLTRENASGGHIVAHSEGGKTEMSNLCVISKEHNQRMGTMNADMYRQIWLQQQKDGIELTETDEETL